MIAQNTANYPRKMKQFCTDACFVQTKKCPFIKKTKRCCEYASNALFD